MRVNGRESESEPLCSSLNSITFRVTQRNVVVSVNQQQLEFDVALKVFQMNVFLNLLEGDDFKSVLRQFSVLGTSADARKTLFSERILRDKVSVKEYVAKNAEQMRKVIQANLEGEQCEKLVKMEAIL